MTHRRMPLLGQRRTRDREHGQILVLFTIFLVALLAFTALVLDLGLLRNNRQILANALDAGALAGGTLMPVGKNGSKEVDVEKAVRDSIRGSYPGIPDSAYTIEYRCLIGADAATGAPYINRDIPIEPAALSPKGATQVCDPTGTLGRRPIGTDFIGAGLTRNAPCDPSPANYPADSDKCNVVVVSGSTTTDFSFGRVVGVNEGNTGVITTAACNGPCGEPVAVPLDVVMVMDRTYSMTAYQSGITNEIPNLKAAGRAVLEAYDPKYQHVALSLIGPSSLNNTCSGTPSGVNGLVIHEPVVPPTVVATYETQQSTNPSGSNVTSLSIPRPSNVANDDVLVATVALKVNSGSTSMSSLGITAPTGWTLIRRTNQGSGNTGVALATYWRRGGGGTSGNPAAYSFTFTGGSNYRASGGIMRFSSVVTSGDPIFNSSTNNGSGNTATANSINNTPANGIVIAAYARSATTSINTPNNWSERYNTTGGSGPSVSANTRSISGNTGNAGAGGGSNAWAAQQIALRPAPTPDPEPSEYGTTYSASYYGTNTQQWIPVGLTGIGTLPGNPQVSEAYNFSETDPINRPLNPNSRIVKAIDCLDAADPYPGTNLRTPIDMARQYLRDYGREGVKKGIIVQTDGSPQYNNVTGDTQNYTCAGTRTAATTAKNDGIEIYTIGFFRGGSIPNCPDSGQGNTAGLLADIASGPRSAPNDCTERENTDGDFFFCASSGADLRGIFLQVATELADLKSRLVSVYPPPNIDVVGPNSGSAAGGYNVTITGKNFTGATSVSFGGSAATSFTVLSDSQISAGVPAGPAGQTVHVRVSTGGGSSPTEPADRFTYLP